MKVVRRADKNTAASLEDLEATMREAVATIKETLSIFYKVEYLYEVRDCVDDLIARWEADLPYDGEPGEEN